MQIGYLADHPAFIPTLAQWHHAQWSYLSPGSTLERRTAHLQGQLGKMQIPTTFVAYNTTETDAEIVIGSASLIAQDMDTRPELSPWLASVYVAAARRRQGIGSALVRRVVEEAAALNVKTLHLFTPDRESFYARLGWSVIERCTYRGYPQVVMALSL
jgi:N-acetylglutamate synthase-like GNAT family acetyltransferase